MTKLQEEYFEWLISFVFKNKFDSTRYDNLLRALHNTMFHYLLSMDENRMIDGINMRYRFSFASGYSSKVVQQELHLNETCSVLEMMVALSVRGDERILFDYESGGSKADVIFMAMLSSLQLKTLSNINFNDKYFDYVMERFLNREYEYTGEGGPFTVNNPRRDMRTVDIWYQMNWYLQEIYKNK